MEYLRSSQSARMASWALRSMLRSCVRKRFLASCWVSVEPPCWRWPRGEVADHGPGEAERVDAQMRLEPPVLDGDEGLPDIGRQILESDSGAAHVAAVGEQRAVGGEDLRCWAGAGAPRGPGSAASCAAYQATTPATPTAPTSASRTAQAKRRPRIERRGGREPPPPPPRARRGGGSSIKGASRIARRRERSSPRRGAGSSPRERWRPREAGGAGRSSRPGRRSKPSPPSPNRGSRRRPAIPRRTPFRPILPAT